MSSSRSRRKSLVVPGRTIIAVHRVARCVPLATRRRVRWGSDWGPGRMWQVNEASRCRGRDRIDRIEEDVGARWGKRKRCSGRPTQGRSCAASGPSIQGNRIARGASDIRSCVNDRKRLDVATSVDGCDIQNGPAGFLEDMVPDLVSARGCANGCTAQNAARWVYRDNRPTGGNRQRLDLHRARTQYRGTACGSNCGRAEL